MGDARVQVIDETLTASKGGLVTGVIYVDFGLFQFPDPNWNDFVVVILGWWLMALIDLVSGTTSQVELRFMDGPLWISTQNETTNLCTMTCLKGPPDRIQYECEGSALELLKSTLEAAARVHGVCAQRGWASPDIDSLGRRIAAGRLLIAPH
ncbi:hypothetical protein LJR220_006238 [Bradyrhizobium sp. LjRoot220]|uniref:hypothetical protein n=1 Tax=Bradyrhizobium sp. LjRoot220 TaxID=3342284 RepID=UPI003ECC58A9